MIARSTHRAAFEDELQPLSISRTVDHFTKTWRGYGGVFVELKMSAFPPVTSRDRPAGVVSSAPRPPLLNTTHVPHTQFPAWLFFFPLSVETLSVHKLNIRGVDLRVIFLCTVWHSKTLIVCASRK